MMGDSLNRKFLMAYWILPFSMKKVPSPSEPGEQQGLGIHRADVPEAGHQDPPRGVAHQVLEVPVPPLMITFGRGRGGATPFLAAQARS